MLSICHRQVKSSAIKSSKHTSVRALCSNFSNSTCSIGLLLVASEIGKHVFLDRLYFCFAMHRESVPPLSCIRCQPSFRDTQTLTFPNGDTSTLRTILLAFLREGCYRIIVQRLNFGFKVQRFLRRSEDYWPLRPAVLPPLPISDPDVKAKDVSAMALAEDPPFNRLIAYYSSWSKLVRAIAWMKRFQLFLLKKLAKKTPLDPETGFLSVEEL